MSDPLFDPKQATIGRVVHDARRRLVRSLGTRGTREFGPAEPVRSLTRVDNDGTYPHLDFGETLVSPGDTGIVRESWSFLGENYYTVQFASASVVIMRGHELTEALPHLASGSPVPHVKMRGVGILESAC